MRNQRTRAGLGLAHRFEDATDQSDIRSAFIGMAKHLRSRPRGAPGGSAFDEAGGGRQTPGWALVRAGRACLDAAEEKGAAALVATRAEVAAYFDTLKTIALRGFGEPETCAEIALVEGAREFSEATAEIARLAVTRNPQDVAAMQKEVREAVVAGTKVLSLGNRLPLPSHPLSMGAWR